MNPLLETANPHSREASKHEPDGAQPIDDRLFITVDPNLDSLERLEAGGPMKLAAWSEQPLSMRLWSIAVVAAAAVGVSVAAAKVFV